MIVTEKEAATKWCPYSRAIVAKDTAIGGMDVPLHQATFNRYAIDRPEQNLTSPPACGCIASECMSWRWQCPEPRPNFILIKPGVEEPDQARWEQIADPSAENLGEDRFAAFQRFPGSRAFRAIPPARTGFCGMAGTP